MTVLPVPTMQHCASHQRTFYFHGIWKVATPNTVWMFLSLTVTYNKMCDYIKVHLKRTLLILIMENVL